MFICFFVSFLVSWLLGCALCRNMFSISYAGELGAIDFRFSSKLVDFFGFCILYGFVQLLPSTPY